MRRVVGFACVFAVFCGCGVEGAPRTSSTLSHGLRLTLTADRGRYRTGDRIDVVGEVENLTKHRVFWGAAGCREEPVGFSALFHALRDRRTSGSAHTTLKERILQRTARNRWDHFEPTSSRSGLQYETLEGGVVFGCVAEAYRVMSGGVLRPGEARQVRFAWEVKGFAPSGFATIRAFVGGSDGPFFNARGNTTEREAKRGFVRFTDVVVHISGRRHVFGAGPALDRFFADRRVEAWLAQRPDGDVSASMAYLFRRKTGFKKPPLEWWLAMTDDHRHDEMHSRLDIQTGQIIAFVTNHPIPGPL